MSDRSRCGAARIFYVADEPSAGIVRVEALSLWRCANLSCSRDALQGSCALDIEIALKPLGFEFSRVEPANRRSESSPQKPSM